jgi:hypothetical protein
MAKRRSLLAPTRAEVNQMKADLEEFRTQLNLQFKRIAQMQAELDHIRSAWVRSPMAERRKTPRP